MPPTRDPAPQPARARERKMVSPLHRALFAAAALALLCAIAAQPPATGDWVTGRATFFSAPAEFKQACRAPSRARSRGGISFH